MKGGLSGCPVSTGRVTLPGLHEKRGREGIDALGVVPHLEGTPIADFWGPSLSFEGKHAFCNVPLLRELTALEEGDGHRWATGRKAFPLETKALAENRIAPPDARSVEERMDTLQALLDRGGAEAGRPEKPPGSRRRARGTPARNLLRRFDPYRREILAFSLDPTVPFTNNQAEQDLRMISVRRKVSGGFRTGKGARIFLRIKSDTQPPRKQGRDVRTWLTKAMEGSPFIPSDARVLRHIL